MINGKVFIAEVKTKSPFGYESKESWDKLFNLANSVGDVVSVHTDERWYGSFDLLERARNMTTKYLLAKGIHGTDEEVERALDIGADYVLVVGRIPRNYDRRIIIEPNSLGELSEVPERYLKSMWNSRDLSTGGLKMESFKQAREIWPDWLCQASNIRTVDDVEEGADAILVGSHLREFVDSYRKV
jgi:indole-3-glycerol phosphate synthase